MKSKLIAILLAVSASTVTGQVTMFGRYDCGMWFKNENAKPWLVGYLSGLNAATAKKNNDPLEKLNSADQAYLWMDNYCKANPLEDVQTGANKLYLELQNKK